MSAQWIFREWLRKQTEREDPVGDFARDWLADPDAAGIRTFSSMDRYLLGRGVANDVIAARDEAAREFITTRGLGLDAPARIAMLRDWAEMVDPRLRESPEWRSAWLKS